MDKEKSRNHWSLEDLSAEYEAIIQAFDGLIYICSQNYEVQFMNQMAIERAGSYPLGQKCYKVIYGQENVCPWCQNDRVFKGEKVTWEVFNPKDNRWHSVINTPIHHPDGTMSKMVLIRDITEAKQADIEVMADITELKKIEETLSLREQ